MRDICKKAGRSNSWMKFGILPLVGAKLSFQTLKVIGKQIRFLAFSN